MQQLVRLQLYTMVFRCFNAEGQQVLEYHCQCVYFPIELERFLENMPEDYRRVSIEITCQ